MTKVWLGVIQEVQTLGEREIIIYPMFLKAVHYFLTRASPRYSTPCSSCRKPLYVIMKYDFLQI